MILLVLFWFLSLSYLFIIAEVEVYTLFWFEACASLHLEKMPQDCLKSSKTLDVLGNMVLFYFIGSGDIGTWKTYKLHPKEEAPTSI